MESLYYNDVLLSSESPNLLNEEIFEVESDTMDSIPGNLAINLDPLDNYSEQELELFGELLMEPDFFVRAEQSREKEEKNRGGPRKNERNSPDSNQKQSKNCFIFYFNVSNLFSFILS